MLSRRCTLRHSLVRAVRIVRFGAYSTIAVSVTLAGCANWSGIAPQLSELDAGQLATGESMKVAVALAGKDAHWPDRQWWTVFADPQLDGLVEAAVNDNPTQAIAAARLREALAVAGQAKAATLPTLDALGSLNRRHWPESGYYNGGLFSGQNTFDNSALLSFDYPLDIFGGRRNAAESALDAAHVAAADQRSAELNLAGNVVRSYIQLSLQYMLLDVAQENLRDQQHTLQLANQRFNAGFGTKLEISQAESPLPQSLLTIEQIQEAIAIEKNELAALTGRGPGAGDDIAIPHLTFSVSVVLPSALPAELIGHRPDIVARRWDVEAQARSIDSAKAAFYPNIDIKSSVGGAAVGAVFSTFLRMSSVEFTGGPAISLPIFEGGRLRASLAGASARYDIAVAGYNDAILQALNQIANQVVSFQSLEKQEVLAKRSVATAQQNYDLAENQFKRGLTDYVNVLSANDLLLTQQQGLRRVTANRFVAYTNLMVALGGGASLPTDSPKVKPPSIVLRTAP